MTIPDVRCHVLFSGHSPFEHSVFAVDGRPDLSLVVYNR
jgi:hypothetical protein